MARVLEVISTRDRSLDARFEHVRALQITMNESERDLLEILSTLARRLGSEQESELGSLAATLRAGADALFARRRALTLEVDATEALAMLSNPSPAQGCDGFARVGNVHRCQVELARAVAVVWRERPAGTGAAEAEIDGDDPASVVPGEPSSEPFALAAADAVSGLWALRLRLRALTRAIEPARNGLASARIPPSHERERQDALRFLDGLSSRARVQSRFVSTAIETMTRGMQRGAL